MDYEALAGVGSIMGSGGMVVMDDTVCMVDVARYFMDFCREESCGKCVPCRVGTTQLHLLLTRITDGQASMADLDRLERLSRMVGRTSLCGLGQARTEPGAEHAAILPRGVPGPHPRPRLPGRGLPDGDAGGRAVTAVHTLTIDGGDVAGADGQTILDVAREHAIDIPTLCHLDGLSDVGACRLCLVEVRDAEPAAAGLHDPRSPRAWR